MARLERQVDCDRVGGGSARWAAELLTARSLIKGHGWLQGNWGSPSRGWCIVGALREAGAGDEALVRLGLAIPVSVGGIDHLSDMAHVLISCNDEVMKSEDEVLAWIDRAIALPAERIQRFIETRISLRFSVTRRTIRATLGDPIPA